MLFGAEAETESDLGELQISKSEIALSALQAGILDKIVIGQTAVSAEYLLQLVLIDAKVATNLFNTVGMHEVAVDANDDIAIGGEGQRVVTLRLDLVGVLRLQARKDIHEIGTDAAGPAFVGVLLLYGSHGSVTDAKVIVHLLICHVDAFEVCMSFHEWSKAE